MGFFNFLARTATSDANEDMAETIKKNNTRTKRFISLQLSFAIAHQNCSQHQIVLL
jgi:hypothetical protein